MDRPLAVVTGASTGIGEAFARLLHKRGYRVLLIARRRERLERICEALNANGQNSAEFEVIDLALSGGMRAAERILRDRKPELLINNVGRGSFGYFDELSVNEEEEMVRLNVIAPLRLSHAVIPSLKERRKGGIIFLSSIAAFQPLPFMGTYAATKSFNLFQALSLFAELKRFNVHVLAVCPGPTATEFGGVARVPGSVTGIWRDSPQMVAEEALRAFNKGNPCVITGVTSWFLWLATKIAPVKISLWILERKLREVLKISQNSHY